MPLYQVITPKTQTFYNKKMSRTYGLLTKAIPGDEKTPPYI